MLELEIEKKRSGKLIVGLDAANLRRGGGVTHLIELIRNAEPERDGIAKVIVWGGEETLAKLPERSWLEKFSPAALNKDLLHRVWWQRFSLNNEARALGCNILFVPGGSYACNFKPVVTMSRNLLPFEWLELRRYGVSMTSLKLLLLRCAQSLSYRRADGVIYLTEYACKVVQGVTGPCQGKTEVIPHGINPQFKCHPKKQIPIDKYTVENPYHVLYVSIIELYKHQWHVVEALHTLRKEGMPIHLDLVGPAYPAALTRLRRAIAIFDPEAEWVHYHGEVPYESLYQIYRRADLGVFASTCENMPNILLETMASGLPITCSNRGPMPEVLGEAGLYFDPENPAEIADSIKKMILSRELRDEKARMSFKQSQQYSWKRCADQTFSFIAEIARQSYSLELNRIKKKEKDVF